MQSPLYWYSQRTAGFSWRSGPGDGISGNTVTSAEAVSYVLWEMSAPITLFTGKYRFLSNFFPSPVVLDGIRYPTVEHAFQAAKTDSDHERRLICAARSPKDAKRIGRSLTLPPDWEETKLGIMKELLRQKFQNPALRQALQDTGSADLIEGNTWGDTYWGCVFSDGAWVGANHLGRLLMEVRSCTGRAMDQQASAL